MEELLDSFFFHYAYFCGWTTRFNIFVLENVIKKSDWLEFYKTLVVKVIKLQGNTWATFQKIIVPEYQPKCRDYWREKNANTVKFGRFLQGNKIQSTNKKYYFPEVQKWKNSQGFRILNLSRHFVN